MEIILILIAILVILAVFVLGVYNGLITTRNRVKESWSGIDVQLKRRSNLIPNLIETVKGYAKHEKSIMTEVTNARKALLSAKDITSKVKAGDKLQAALKSIFAIAENYPQLKAN